jgi:hypothetical protein
VNLPVTPGTDEDQEFYRQDDRFVTMLRAIMWGIIGTLIGGAVSVGLDVAFPKPTYLVLRNVPIYLGAGLPFGGYLLWARWRKRWAAR